jgi:Zn-dependent protease with chaperone function
MRSWSPFPSRGLFQAVIILSAAAIAVAPPPPAAVERYYSDWFYPALQTRLTSWANQSPLALFDFIVAVAIAAVVFVLWRSFRTAVRRRQLVPALRGIVAVATLLAVVYLWFEIAWGLNYARVPLEASVGYQPSRVSVDAVRALAERAVGETNRGYAPGHAAGFPEIGDVPAALVRAFHDVERRLGRPRPTVPGRPKRTALSVLFRAGAVSGMHAPFMLETLLNPDLTPPERPAVLAHEWAHLAGYAPEDDASFVGLLAALRADPGARYSAWLSLAFEASAQLPRVERQRLLSRLEAGPRQDQEAIRVRLQSRVETVERVSWETYDRYLKAQGVREGVQNYSRVVQLIVGSGALDW